MAVAMRCHGAADGIIYQVTVGVVGVGGGVFACMQSHRLFTPRFMTPRQQLHQLSPLRNVGPLC